MEVFKTEPSREMVDQLGIADFTGLDKKPSLVYDLKHCFSPIWKSSSSTTTGGTLAIYTVNSDRDFALTYFNLNYHCDAASDLERVYLYGTNTDGATIVYIAELCHTTGAAGEDSITASLAFPIIIRRGTVITMSKTNSAGVMRAGATIAGFYI